MHSRQRSTVPLGIFYVLNSAAVVAYLVLVPIDGFFVLSLRWSLSPSYAVLACLLMLAALQAGTTQRIALPPAGGFLIAFLGALLPYAFLSPAQPDSLLLWTTLLSYLAALIAIWNLHILSPLPVRSIVVACASAVLLAGTSAKMAGIYAYGDRLTIAEAYNPSWFAASIAATMLALIASTSSTIRSIGITFLLLCTLAPLLFATQGRNAMLSLVVALVGCSLLLWARTGLAGVPGRAQGKHILPCLLLGAIFLGVACVHYLYKTGGLVEYPRIVALYSGDPGRMTANRTLLWQRYVENMPLGLGVGLAAANQTVGGAGELPPHNTYILLFVEAGITGILLWLAFHGALTYHVLKISSVSVAGSGCIAFALFFFLFAAGNDIPYYRYYWHALILAYLVTYPMGRTGGRYVPHQIHGLAPPAYKRHRFAHGRHITGAPGWLRIGAPRGARFRLKAPFCWSLLRHPRRGGEHLWQ